MGLSAPAKPTDLVSPLVGSDVPGGEADLRLQLSRLTADNERLAEAVAARDALLAVAGHELRNPMTPIIGRVEMLRRQLSRPEPNLEKAKAALEQIEWLMGQYMKRATTLLDVSRITSGRLELAAAPVEVGALVAQVIETFRPIVNNVGAKLVTDFPDETLMAIGDALALEVILDNLVANAIKYGDGSPITVSVGADEDAARVQIQVSDQGPGISAADQARIFEQFERAVTPRQQQSGFGVGLWIVRQLSEAMGGAIEVHSTLGAGTAFRVSLPLQPPGDTA